MFSSAFVSIRVKIDKIYHESKQLNDFIQMKNMLRSDLFRNHGNTSALNNSALCVEQEALQTALRAIELVNGFIAKYQKGSKDIQATFEEIRLEFIKVMKRFSAYM